MTIKCEDIGFKYNIEPVLEDISINFKEGKLYGVIGPNSSGKTTLLKVLYGILKPNYGNVIIDNYNLRKLSILEIAKKIAVVNQSNPLDFDFTVKEIVMMGRYAHIGRFSQISSDDKKIINEIFEQFNLTNIQTRSFNELSGGEQQNVIIARAIAQNSKIILLDEPTNHLDIKYKLEFMDMLKRYVEKRLNIIIVLHDLNLATEYCDKLILLNNGRIVAYGNPEEIITKKNIKSVYKIDVLIRKNQISNSIYITPFRKIYPFISDKKDLKKPRIHIIAGGGTALEFFPKLIDYSLSVGIVSIMDDDYMIARELNIKVISENPFSEISDKAADMLRNHLTEVDCVILTNLPFGKANLRNLEILDDFKKKILILEKEPIGKRDFTGGLAIELYTKIKKKNNVKIVNNIKELINNLKIFEENNNFES